MEKKNVNIIWDGEICFIMNVRVWSDALSISFEKFIL